MDYKEKYENALNRAKKFKEHLLEINDEGYANEIDCMFPELKESEDEKIRKELLKHCINRRDGKQICVDASDYRRWADWLEKHTEPQPYRGNADTMRKNLIKAFKSVGGNHWGGFDVRDIIHFLESKDAIELEKQGEKHIDGKLSNLLNRVICRFINDPYIPCSERDEVSNKIIPYVEQLEKQGEQKPQKTSIWKHWKHGIAGNEDGKLIYLVKTGNTYKLCSCISFECDYIELSELDNLMFEKQGEQNPTWSEEDEKYINDILAILGGGRGYRSNRQIEEWLKSLKPQSQWKPTEEQLMALRDAIDNNEMESLYNDLKKL